MMFFVTVNDYNSFQNGSGQLMFYGSLEQLIEYEGEGTEYYEFTETEYNEIINNNQSFKLN